MTIKVKKLHKDAVLPKRAYPDDAGIDVCCYETQTILPGETKKIPTGLAFEVAPGYVGLIWDKSSIGSYGIKTLGGVIDSGYRGELSVVLHNMGRSSYTFEKGHKLAQMLIQQVELCDVVEADELTPAPRGANAFGSTGK